MNIQSEEPFISVIILNYNGKELLEDCLTSVLQSDYSNFEVVFVDNGSTDGSVDFVKERYGYDSRLNFVINHENLGFAEGNNVGAQHARGDFLLFLNNDTKVYPSWLKELVKTTLSEPLIGITICRIISSAYPDGSFIGNVDKYGNAAITNLRDTTNNIDVVASGPAFLIKKNVWDEVRGFDSKYFIYMEDIDLAWRVKLLGYKITCGLNSIVYHIGEKTTCQVALVSKRYFVYRNTLRTLLKNYSVSMLLRVLPISLVLIFAQSIASTYILKRPNILVKLIEAFCWNIKNFRDTWALHKDIQKTRVMSDKSIQRDMEKFAFPASFGMRSYQGSPTHVCEGEVLHR